MKTRYFIYISFKGTSYHGWQVQPNSITVQNIIDNALSTILNERIVTTGAGRTDTGVHALVFCAHFESMSGDHDTDKNLVFKLNRFLPKDISVSGIFKVGLMLMPDSVLFQEHINTIFQKLKIHSCRTLHGICEI